VDEMSGQLAEAGGNSTLLPEEICYQKTQENCHFGIIDVDGRVIKWILQNVI